MTRLSPAVRPGRLRMAPKPLAKALAACSLLTLTPLVASPQVLPSGAQVVHGQAQIATRGSSMTVTNSAGAILDWQSFSIGAGASVHFAQPDVRSKVLNRVVGNNPSNILGGLSSNGEVWLLNPHGVLFGHDARIDVGGLVASTLRLNDLDWLGGRLHLTADGGAVGDVVNHGSLRTPLGGRVALIGTSVRNEGLIDAPDGQVVLAAGHSVDLVDTGAPRLGVRVTAPSGEAVNLGQVLSSGGQIDIHAAAVNQSGIVSASSLQAGPGGEIWIQASGRTTLADGSLTQATSTDGVGGQVRLLGAEVGMTGRATVDVSGAVGGGQVSIGGGREGQDARYPNARAVYVGPETTVRADALTQGDGGEIVLWSDAATRAFGSLSARGGAFGGDGGFIETSGGWLDARPATIDVTAPRGRAGTWLLDPNDIYISDGLSDTNISGNPDFTTTDDAAEISSATIVAALNAGNNVTITTGSAGSNSEPGDIWVDLANIVTNAPSPVSLTLTADRNIDITDSVISSGAGAPLTVSLQAARSNEGTINIFNSSITTGGGNITLGGLGIASGPTAVSPFLGAVGYDDGVDDRGAGIWLANAALDAGSGTVTMRGNSIAQLTGAYGIYIDPDSTVSAATIDVRGWVDSPGSLIGPSADPISFPDGEFTTREGVELFGSLTASNAMTIDGSVLSPVFRGDTFVAGVSVEGALTVTGVGGLDISGTLQDESPTGGTDWVRRGAVVLYPSATVTSAGSDITITGVDNSPGTFYYGVYGDGGTINGGVARQVTLTSDERTLLDSTVIDVPALSSLTISGSDVILDAPVVTGGVLSYLNVTGQSLVEIRNGTSLKSAIIDIDSPFGDLLVSNSAIEASEPGSVSLHLSSAGRQQYTDSSISSLGGNITLDGNTPVGLPLGGLGLAPVSGALESNAGSGLAGIEISGSSMSTSGGGQLVIVGASRADTSAGVSITSSSLAARDITIVGENLEVGSTGVALSSAQVLTPHGIDIQGVGGAYGVTIDGDFRVRVLPAVPDVSASLRILGEGATDAGVYVDARSATTFTPISAWEGATLTIRGESDFWGVHLLDDELLARPTVEVGGGGAMTIGDRVPLLLTYTDPQFEGAYLTSDGTIDIAGSYEIYVHNFSLIESTAGLTLQSAGKVTVNTSSLSSIESAADISVLSTAFQTYFDASVYSNGGTITLAGTTTYALPLAAGTFDAAEATVGSGSGSGIDITLSSIESTGGRVIIAGASRTSSGVGVNLDQSSAIAAELIIRGNAAEGNASGGGTGVQLLTSTLEADVATIQGIGGYWGIYWYNGDAVGLTVLPGGSAYVGGESVGFDGVGVDISSESYTSAPPILATGAVVSIYGQSSANGTAISIVEDPLSTNVTIDAGGGSLVIGDSNAGEILLTDITLSSLGAGAGGVQFTSSGLLSLSSVEVTASGAIRIETPDLVTSGTTTITSAGTGDAIVLAGGVSTPMTSWTNASDPATVLQASAANGRWLAHFVDVTSSADYPSGLPYDFKLYNALPGDGASDAFAGNGLVFSTPQFAAVTATFVSRTYDGTTTAQLGSLGAVGVNGDQVVGASLSGVAEFASANAGINIPVSLGYSFDFEDSDGKPVYGYLYSSNLRGNIDPAPLTISVSVADKVYDATLAAVASAQVIGGLIGSETLTLTALAEFPVKDVGTYPLFVDVVLADGTNGGLASNYTAPTGLVAGARITPAPLTLSGLTAAPKIYDATTAVVLSGSALISPLGADTVNVVGTASGTTTSKNVGSARPVTVNGLTLGGADAGNYTLLLSSDVTVDVLPRSLLVSGLTVQDKVYDGTTVATASGTATVVPLGADVVAVSGTAGARFVDRNVGVAKAVELSGLTLVGEDAANYTVVAASDVTADITPATLTYLAEPVSVALGQALPAFGGQVTGFVGGDTLGTATTGTLYFESSVSSASTLGTFALAGGGLSAVNYTFVQAPGNATALTVTPGLPLEEKPIVNATDVLPKPNGVLPVPPSPPGDPRDVGLVDVVTPPPVLPGPPPSPGPTSFDEVPLESMTQEEIGTMLDLRDAYKKQIFAEALEKLEADPTLADGPECKSLPEALAGTCVVTESVRQQLRDEQAASSQVAIAPPAPAPTAEPAPATAPAAPPTAAPSPAPAPAPTAVAVAPRVVPAPAPVALPQRKRVREAALPQITRKVAVLIGVGRYGDGMIPSLDNSVKDVQAMARVVEQQLGYETLVLENADKARVVSTLNRLALDLRPNDSVVVYYAGHGELVEATKLGYWQLSDADSKRPETWLSNADISRILAAMPSSQVSLISDSCYSGSLITEERIRASTAPVDPIALLTRKTVVIMTSGGNEPVFDSGKNGHSPFAFNLMNTLQKVNDWSPGGRVFERVRFAVAREVPQRPQYGASSSAGHQAGGDYLFEQRRLEE